MSDPRIVVKSLCGTLAKSLQNMFQFIILCRKREKAAPALKQASCPWPLVHKEARKSTAAPLENRASEPPSVPTCVPSRADQVSDAILMRQPFVVKRKFAETEIDVERLVAAHSHCSLDPQQLKLGQGGLAQGIREEADLNASHVEVDLQINELRIVLSFYFRSKDKTGFQGEHFTEGF